MRLFVLIPVLLSFLPPALAANDRSAIAEISLDQHILPGFTTLAQTSRDLANTARDDCRATSEPLKAAYHTAFDAWVAVSHLRFGPTEQDNRAFAIAFWPDTKGFIPKSLARLISSEDPVIEAPDAYDTVSIAARGFYALEFMLYDPKVSVMGAEEYRCALVRAITGDIAATSADILADWQQDYAKMMRAPGTGNRYKNRDEVVQELFKALNTGLQLASDTRLGRPMGSFDHPRPNRAEARRSGRSLHNLEMSLVSLRQLAGILSAGNDQVSAKLDKAFAKALNTAAALEDPVFVGVARPQGRLKVEALRQTVEDIRKVALEDLGPSLGVDAGFNSLDGD